MTIKFLGTGGAFDFSVGNSSVWININDKNILIDCGHTVYPVLRKKGLVDDIDYILISHFHDDHVGSLCTTILHHSFYMHKPKKTQILYPDESFKYTINNFLTYGLAKVEEYVEFVHISEIPEIRAINTFGLHVKNMQSYGYIFEDESEIIAFSGDLGDADIIFSCLPKTAQKPIKVFHEMSFDRADGVHSYYKDLFPYLDVYQLYGYHVDPESNPSDNQVPLVHNYPEFLV